MNIYCWMLIVGLIAIMASYVVDRYTRHIEFAWWLLAMGGFLSITAVVSLVLIC